MGNTLTTRQKELLSIIYDFIRNTGYPPTYEQMRENLGVVSNQSIIDLLEKLKKGNLIIKGEGARSLAITFLGYKILDRLPLAPILGITTAGVPAETIEINGDWMPMSKTISRLENDVFMLRINGDSMINAGIDDNDVVLVQEKKEFVSGEIVLADCDGEATVKRFISDDKPPYVYLKPENPAYPIILFRGTTTLKGKIISVLKNNQWKPIK